VKAVTTIPSSCITFAAGNAAKIECNTLFAPDEALPTVSRVKLPVHTTRAQRSLIWIGSCDVCCVVEKLGNNCWEASGTCFAGAEILLTVVTKREGDSMQYRCSDYAVWLQAAAKVKANIIDLPSNFYCKLSWRVAGFSQKCALPSQRSLAIRWAL